MKIRTYSEMLQYSTFEERFDYLMLSSRVGIATFGFDRYLNQAFYHSDEWYSVRDEVILRDDGCDLAIFDREITGGVRVHHMNPVLPEDLENFSDNLLDPEFLICTSLVTHNAIHYGSTPPEAMVPIQRYPGDTTPWK